MVIPLFLTLVFKCLGYVYYEHTISKVNKQYVTALQKLIVPSVQINRTIMHYNVR